MDFYHKGKMRTDYLTRPRHVLTFQVNQNFKLNISTSEGDESCWPNNYDELSKQNSQFEL